MYRAILPDGNLSCDYFERGDHGIEVYTADDELKAFIPYENLIALMNDDVREDEPLGVF